MAIPIAGGANKQGARKRKERQQTKRGGEGVKIKKEEEYSLIQGVPLGYEGGNQWPWEKKTKQRVKKQVKWGQKSGECVGQDFREKE